MAYQLGIDLGTTYTAAAVARDGRVEIVTLGNRAATVPSVIFLRDDGAILAGEPASRRLLSEPHRVGQEFKRRLGDTTPLLLGGTPYSAESLMAKLLRWVTDRVAEREGGPYDAVAVTYPANWGPYKRELLDQALRMAELTGAVTLTEPEAAAIYYATQERVEPGTVVAVYDLGGGTFDAVVLRKRSEAGFEILGAPEGIERLGGIDIDQAVFAHVARSVAGALVAPDPDSPATVAALARLREECVEAKEALSGDSEVAIPVLLPEVQTEVRLTRAELEAMIRPTLEDTIASLRRAIRSADLEPAEIDRVLLVGGSSRIPLVAELVTAELGRPVAVDAHPKHAVALGAALTAADMAHVQVTEVAAADEEVPPPLPPAPVIAPVVPPPPAVPPPVEPPAPPPLPVPVPEMGVPPPEEPPAKTGRGRWIGVAVAVVALAGLLVAGALILGDDDGGGGGVAVEATTTTPATTTTSTTAPPTTTAPPIPPGSFVEVTGVTVQGDTYAIAFAPREFSPSFDAGFHAHFFWDTTPAATAGTNGVPQPGVWLAYAGASPAVDELFRVANRAGGANAICSLVATSTHEIADVDNDGEVDPDTGTCAPLP